MGAWTGIVVLLGLAAAGCGHAATHVAAQAAAAQSSVGASCVGQATITAHGDGSAAQAPDELTVVGNVTTSASQAATALSENNVEAAAAIARLRTQVSAGDLQTSGLTISPQYSATRVPTITGYLVVDTVTAQIRQGTTSQNWSTAGSLIDAVVSKSGNAFQLQSLAFSVADDGGLVSLAQAAGVTQAAAQAAAMARAAGLTLGTVCAITDAAPMVVEPTYTYAQPTSEGASGGASVPLAAGTQKDDEAVTVVYLVS